MDSRSAEIARDTYAGEFAMWIMAICLSGSGSWIIFFSFLSPALDGRVYIFVSPCGPCTIGGSSYNRFVI